MKIVFFLQQQQQQEKESIALSLSLSPYHLHCITFGPVLLTGYWRRRKQFKKNYCSRE